MAPTNYDMSIECIGTAEKAGTLQLAHIEAMAAQTYATLALVDAIQQLSSAIAADNQQLREEIISTFGELAQFKQWKGGAA